MSATRGEHCGGHRALVYDGPDAFVRGVGGFVREGVQDGAHVMAAVPPEKLDWLREDLGEVARAVDFVDATVLYERPGPMFSRMLDYLSRYGADRDGGGARIIAEQALALRTPAHVRAYMRYEAASNVALQRFAASVLCPYDSARLPAGIIEDALRTHPEVVEDGRARPSGLFTDPRAFVRGQGRPSLRSPHAPGQPLDRREDVARARALVRAQAEAAGLAERTIEDLLLAVSEVATNAVVHGGGAAWLWSYVDGGALVCHVRDGGTGLRDPLAGYLPPDLASTSGRGLWLAHQLCDVVDVASDATGTDVHLQVPVPDAT